MKVRFWGTRGSLPVSLTAADVREKIAQALALAVAQGVDAADKIPAFVEGLGFDLAGTFGGQTSCVELVGDGREHVLCDLGSGARVFGGEMLRRFGPGAPQTYHVFMSHVHWDHIMGFPFFTPSYIPGNRIVIHGCHAELEAAFRRQHGAPSFPVDFSKLGAKIEFDVLAPDTDYDIAGFKVRASRQVHEGDSYGWRFEREGQSVVYATDSEHKLDDTALFERVSSFFRGADLVIFDAMYSLADAISVKADWGHSSNVMGVELCQMAGVKTLCLFHHEPIHADVRIAALLAETRRFEEITREGAPLSVIAAFDGLELVL